MGLCITSEVTAKEADIELASVSYCIGWKVDNFTHHYLWFDALGIGYDIDLIREDTSGNNYIPSGKIYSYWEDGDWLVMHDAPEWQRPGNTCSPDCPMTFQSREVPNTACLPVRQDGKVRSLIANGKRVGEKKLRLIPNLPQEVRAVKVDLWQTELTRSQRQQLAKKQVGKPIIIESKTVPNIRRLVGRYETRPLGGLLPSELSSLRGTSEYLDFINNRKGTFVRHGFEKDSVPETCCCYYYKASGDRLGVYIGIANTNDHQLMQVEKGVVSKDGKSIKLTSTDIDGIRIGRFPVERTFYKER
jgi:hypothetical protein